MAEDFMDSLMPLILLTLLGGRQGMAPQATAMPQGGTEPTPENIYAYLLQQGVPAPHAAGMISNIRAESNFNPQAIGDQGTSGGLFQHHADRFAGLKQATGGDLNDWRKQVDFALSEPDSQRYLAQQFQSPADASQWFTQNWERPANAAAKAQQRLQYLPQYAAEVPAPPIEIPQPDLRKNAEVLQVLLAMLK